MTTETEAVQAQAHHWETSWAPLVAVLGIFLLVPLAFSSYFVYESTLMAVIFAGLGTPLLLAGVAKWVDEGMSEKGHAVGAAKVGLPLFIVSEVFIFLSIFVSYWVMRLNLDLWPPEGTPEMPTLLPLFMTVVLVTSSFTIHVGEVKLEQDDLNGYRKWLIITIVLGLVFLSCTFYEYNHLVGVGFIPSTNAFSTVFYSLTGFHASHVFIGAAIFVAVLIPALAGRVNHTFAKCASFYWHFVDIVWFFVVSQVYFW